VFQFLKLKINKMTAIALKSTRLHLFSFQIWKRSVKIIIAIAIFLHAEISYTQVINTFPYLEDFETFAPLSVNNSCSNPVAAVANGWQQDTLDAGNWDADFGGTSTIGTGPGATPTTSGNGTGTDFNPGTVNGIYLYTEVYSCYNATINLISPYFDFTVAPLRLLFAYHMFGSSMGSLHIDVYHNGIWDLDVWTKAGDQGMNWNQADINLSSYNTDSVKIRIRGITGISYYTDMAIDDFNLLPIVADDAGVVSIDSPDFACPGNSNVVASIRNFGSNTINTLNINWKINNILQTPLSYSQAIQPDSVVQITLGLYNFQPNTSYDIVCNTSGPNGNTDNDPGNDTSSHLGFYTALPAGTYTVGGVNPDYPTIADAANALSSSGICGPVVFNIRPGTYNQQVILDNVAGTSASNTIIFQSESGDSTDVVMQYAPSLSSVNYTLKIWNTDYVTFRNLTISTNGTNYATLVDLNGGSDYVTFNNDVFNGHSGGSSSTLRSVIYSNGGIDNFFTFRNNVVEDGTHGLYLQGNSSTDREKGHIIENNIFHVFSNGIVLRYADSCRIINNTIASNQYGIYNSSQGIYMYYSDGPNLIKKNLIQSLTGAYGIYMSNCSAASANPGIIENNMIYVGGASVSYGIYLVGNTANYNFYFNTIDNVSYYSYAKSIYVNTSGLSNFRFVNNLISNRGGGVAFYVNNNSAIIESDYNDIYSNGGYIGYWSGNRSDINDWKSASNMDTHSLDLQPGFLGGTDLHVSSGGINNRGIPIAGINTDIDGDIRNTTTPDLGADEFTPPANDIGVVGFASPKGNTCDANDSTIVSVIIYNFGSQPQVNFDVRVRIYQIQIGQETVTDTVFPGDTLIWTLSNTVDLSIPGMYPFRGLTLLANDANPLNDSIGNVLITSNSIINQFPYITNFDNNGGSIPLDWINDIDDGSENWNFNNTGYPYFSGGPIADHTTGSGYFAWVDASYPNSPSINLTSSCIDLGTIQNPILEFYKWDNDSASSVLLHLDILDNGVWSLDAAGPFGYQNGNNWQYQSVSLKAYSGSIIKVRFRAEDRGINYSGDIAIDDIKIYNMGPVNTGVVKVLQPNNGCGLTDIEPVQVKIQSTGVDTLFPGTVIPVSFKVDNGTAINENIILSDTMAQFDYLYYTFNNTANLFTEGTYLVKAWTDMPLDDDYSNDTSSKSVTNIPVIASSWPYYEDFENGNGGWVPDGTNSSWQLGTPAGTNIIGAASGQNAYMTHLNGNYNNNEDSWVISPCFDFSGLNKPQIAIHLNWDTQTSFDGAVLQYSTNNGQTWSNVGNYSDRVNWFNDNSIDALPGGSYSGWSGSGISGGSQGWISVKHELDALGGKPAVRLRIAFGSSSFTNTYDGVAFDDIGIGETPVVNLGNGLDTIEACGSITLDAGNPGALYIWNSGQATQKITILAGAQTITTTYYVWVETLEGLYNSDTVIVVLHPGPHVDLGQDVSVCGANNYVLNAGNPGSIYLWDDGSSAKTRTVTQNGTYWVSVTKYGCTRSDTINVSFMQFPVAGFTVSVPTGSKTATFNNTSSNATAYDWDFGDGFNSTQQNPTHTYVNAGVYTVTLIVSNDCGSDTFKTTVQIFPTGIDAISGLEVFRIFPVPSNGQLLLSMQTGKALHLTLDLLSIEGKVINSIDLGMISGSYSKSLDFSKLSKGIYFIRLSGNEASVMKKIILQ